jgi:hypothetical protein
MAPEVVSFSTSLMKYPFFLLASSLLLAGTAHAQATFTFGPRVGLNVARAHFPAPPDLLDLDAKYTNLAGLEAGVTGNLQLGHFAFQPSVLFSQKGYASSGISPAYVFGNPPFPRRYEQRQRLNYLTLPLNFAFTLRHDGQGLQAFAGPYLGLVVGGSRTHRLYNGNSSGAALEQKTSRQVKAASGVTDGSDYEYAQRFDGGVQAGIGYRLNAFQLQASYSLGLRNVAVQFYGFDGVVYNPAAYYNRAFQVSLSYLMGAKS